MGKLGFKIISILLATLLVAIPPGLAATLFEPEQTTDSELSSKENNIITPGFDQHQMTNSLPQLIPRGTQTNEKLQSISGVEPTDGLGGISEKYMDRMRITTSPDGTKNAEFYIKPTFYLDRSSNQQFIDTNIVSSESSASSLDDLGIDPEIVLDYDYLNIKNNLKTYFAEQYSYSNDASLLQVTNEFNEYPVSWQPLGLSVDNFDLVHNTDLGEDKFKMIDSNLNDAEGEIEDNRITFRDIYHGCDDTYTVLPNELKHDLILNQFPDELLPSNSESMTMTRNTDMRKQTFDYYGILNLPEDLAPVLDNKIQTSAFDVTPKSTIELRNANGKIHYVLSAAVAYEQAEPENIIDCSYSFSPLGLDINGEQTWTKTLVILRTDLDWLLDARRSYPVILDPSILTPNYYAEGEGFDTYLVKGDDIEPEWSEYNFGGSNDLKVSLAGPSVYSNEHFYYRSILKFPGIDSISKYADIVDARLTLHSQDTSGDIAISVFKLYDDWIEGNGTEAMPGTVGATWNHSGYNIWLGGNYDGDNTEPDTVLVNIRAEYNWEVSSIIDSWVKKPGTNFGFLFSGTDKEDVVHKFYSSDISSIQKRPVLYVKYNTPPRSTGVDTIVVYEDDEEVVVELTDIFHDPDSADFISYQIYVNESVGFQKDGVFSSKNVTVDLQSDRIVLIPGVSESYGEDNITLRVNDGIGTKWVTHTIMVIVQESNDPPKITSISGAPIYKANSEHQFPYVELDAIEDDWKDYNIEVEDPDNPDYFESQTLSDPKYWEGKKIKDHTLPGDLEFEWERDKIPLSKFVISEREDYATITFLPDNSLVGIFIINVTVYDTAWYKPPWYPKPKKLEISNYTVKVIFKVENTNNPPNKPRITDPYTFSEFSAGDLIKFTGKGSDPDIGLDSKEKLTYRWESSIDGYLDTGTVIKTTLSKGTHLIRLIVEDQSKKRNEANISVLVRNRATIDDLNSTYTFTDEEEDVICYYYSINTDVGDETFRLERDGNFPEYNIFIDIIELTSVYYDDFIFINLTVSQDFNLQEDSKNFEYVFSIYLMEPDHQEKVPELTKVGYDARRFDDLYKPDVTEYYGKFGLSDGNIINNGRTLSIKKHLGDLENGDGINSKLKSDFSIFATLKVELKQHPSDSFEHIICYDSAGIGAEPAPSLQPKKKPKPEEEKGLDIGVVVAATILVIVIIMILVFGMIMLRKEGMVEKKQLDKTPATTTTTTTTKRKTKAKGKKRKKGKKKGDEIDYSKPGVGMPPGQMPMPMPFAGPGMGMGTGFSMGQQHAGVGTPGMPIQNPMFAPHPPQGTQRPGMQGMPMFNPMLNQPSQQPMRPGQSQRPMLPPASAPGFGAPQIPTPDPKSKKSKKDKKKKKWKK